MILTIKFRNGTTVHHEFLSIHNAPKEEDAFEYLPNYDSWIETFVTEEKNTETATSGNPR